MDIIAVYGRNTRKYRHCKRLIQISIESYIYDEWRFDCVIWTSIKVLGLYTHIVDSWWLSNLEWLDNSVLKRSVQLGSRWRSIRRALNVKHSMREAEAKRSEECADVRKRGAQKSKHTMRTAAEAGIGSEQISARVGREAAHDDWWACCRRALFRNRAKWARTTRCAAAQTWSTSPVLLHFHMLCSAPTTVFDWLAAYACAYAGREVSDQWYHEIATYAFGSGTGKAGNFTQLVWHNKIGFFKARSNDGLRCIVVAHYSPTGNVTGL